MLTVCLTVVAAIAIPSSCLGKPVQWPGNGHWYEAVYRPEGIVWETARAAAENAGGYLATVTSEEENTFVFGLISDERFWYLGEPGFEHSFGPWLGGYQSDKEAEPAGHWRWMTEEPWLYANWESGEPNDSGGDEDWIHYFTLRSTGVLSPGPTWNDASGEDQRRGFVVEWTEDPSPTFTTSWASIKALYSP